MTFSKSDRLATQIDASSVVYWSISRISTGSMDFDDGMLGMVNDGDNVEILATDLRCW